MTTCLQTSVLNVPLGYVLSDSIYDLHEFHFTVEAWIMPQNSGVIVTNKAAGGGNSEYGGFTFSVSTDGRLRLSEDNGFAYYAVNSVPITRLFDGNWHHVAGMRHFPDLSLYVDGEQVTVQVDSSGDASTMDLQQAGPFGVACSPSYDTMSGVNSPSSLLAGYLAEVRLWKRPFTLQALQANMVQRLTGHEPALVALWAFADGTANDLTGAHNGTATPDSFRHPPVRLMEETDMADDASSAQAVIQSLLGDLVKGALSEIGSEGASWILTAVLGLGGNDDQQILDQLSQIESTLQNIESQITALGEEITQAEQQIVLAVEWNGLVNGASAAITRLQTRFTTLSQLAADDTQTAQDLKTQTLDTNNGVADDLALLNNYILNGLGGEDPGAQGLLQMWINANTQKSVQSYQRGGVGPGTPLDAAAQAITSYFTWLVGVQVRGITLLVNAYEASNESDMAQKNLVTWNATMQSQAELYRQGMEALAVAYCGDQTLLGLFAGPHWRSSPAYLADQTLANTFLDNDLVVRIWGGQGKGTFSFDTGTLVTNASEPGPALTLTGGGAPLTPALPTGLYTLFPSQSGAQWSLYRYVFVSPPPGSYQITPGVPATPFFDCWIDTSQFVQKYIRANPTFVVDTDHPASGFAVTLTGRTAE